MRGALGSVTQLGLCQAWVRTCILLRRQRPVPALGKQALELGDPETPEVSPVA